MPSLPLPAQPAAQPKYYGVQILRGLAALIVVLHHQAEAAGGVFDRASALTLLGRGAFGTDIFFPISGFVMYLTASSILKRPPVAGAWKAFAWRRILRIAPMYWFFTVLKLALLVLFPAAVLHYQFRLWNAVAAFVFLPVLNYMSQPEPPLVVGWTLSYEMFFYGIVALAIAWRLPLLRWCAWTIGLLACVGLVIPHRWGGLTYLADPVELEFLAGMLIAAGASRVQKLPGWAATAILLASCGFVLGYPVVAVEFVPQRALIWGVPGALIVLAAVALEPRLRPRRDRLLLLLGDASFSLYLTHTFVIPATRTAVVALHLTGAAGLTVFLAAGLALSLAVGILFHLYVELPLLGRLMALRPPWSVRSGEAVLP